MRTVLCFAVLVMTMVSNGRVLAADDKTKPAADAINAFAIDLYKQVAAPAGANAFFSPSSVSTALAMTSLGAKGQTQQEMLAVLKFGGGDAASAERVHAAYAELMKLTAGGGGDHGYQLSMANRLWGQQGFHFMPAFLDATQKYYGAPLETVNFADTEAARAAINKWVDGQTAHKISELLKPGVLSGRTTLVLTNAVYFKGTWASQFKKEQTKNEAFHVSPGTDVNVSMMHQSHKFAYAEDDAAQVLAMPYGNGDLSMVVMLPNKVDGLGDLERKLSGEWVAGVLGKLKARQAIVALPRFHMGGSIELSKVLSAMGMPLAFEMGKADFSGMTTQEKLAIDKVVHEAVVTVDEEGTEAAAATAVTMKRMAAKIGEEPVIFRADHPFVFVIRDNRSGAILFMGKVVRPA